jgi:hypothetical protein
LFVSSLRVAPQDTLSSPSWCLFLLSKLHHSRSNSLCSRSLKPRTSLKRTSYHSHRDSSSVSWSFISLPHFRSAQSLSAPIAHSRLDFDALDCWSLDLFAAIKARQHIIAAHPELFVFIARLVPTHTPRHCTKTQLCHWHISTRKTPLELLDHSNRVDKNSWTGCQTP